jgi:16S rRNA processing protein RimM
VFVELGKIVGVWGVKGWIKLHSYTRNRADISQYKTWYLSQTHTPDKFTSIEVLGCREQGQGMVAQLVGVNDRDQAQAMIGKVISVKQSDLPKLPKGEYYWQQLIGLSVVSADKEIGRLDSILDTGANDVLVVKQVQQDQPDVLIPYTDEAVLEVDLEEGCMTVDWDPSYLLD